MLYSYIIVAFHEFQFQRDRELCSKGNNFHLQQFSLYDFRLQLFLFLHLPFSLSVVYLHLLILCTCFIYEMQKLQQHYAAKLRQHKVKKLLLLLLFLFCFTRYPVGMGELLFFVQTEMNLVRR